MKTIVFIPPNGILKKQDFSLQRIAKHLSKDKNIKSILLYIGNEQDNQALEYFDEIIKVNSKKKLFKRLKNLEYSTIFSRSWMHAYPFSAQLVKKFDNVIVNIKDWNFATKEEYKFLFGNDDDFDAIKYIFKNAKNVLSHFTKEQAKIWAKDYDVNKDKFLFFPEYCDDCNFEEKLVHFKNKNKITLVHAGTVPPSSKPEGFFMTKGLLRSAKKLTKQNISINLVIPPKSYEYLLKSNLHYKDLLYENEFNDKFNIFKGKNLNASVLNKFDFGFFQLEYHTKNEYLNKYVVPSKFAFYLEAGIPIVINKKFKSLSKIVQKNNLGIVFSNSDLYNLDDKLRKITQKEYVGFLLSIKKFRNKFVLSKKLNFLNLTN